MARTRRKTAAGGLLSSATGMGTGGATDSVAAVTAVDDVALDGIAAGAAEDADGGCTVGSTESLLPAEASGVATGG